MAKVRVQLEYRNYSGPWKRGAYHGLVLKVTPLESEGVELEVVSPTGARDYYSLRDGDEVELTNNE